MFDRNKSLKIIRGHAQKSLCSFSSLFFRIPLWESLMAWAGSQALWCDADVALALTSCPYDAGAKMAQVQHHLQSWAAGSCAVQDVNVPTLILCSLFSLSRNSPSIPAIILDDVKLVCLSFSPPPLALLCASSPIKTLLILCHSGVFSSAISWPGACASLSLGWVCLVDCSTGTDWHSSWGLQGLHTQSTKHVSVWEAALIRKYEERLQNWSASYDLTLYFVMCWNYSGSY